ncbi:MAG: hypothetical protein ACSHYF_13005 [Verrucomicrobiaceae bacterium]
MSLDPYSSPESQVTPPMPPPMIPKPARMLVFGIIHIVGAVIGFAGLAVNLFQGDPKEAFIAAFNQPGQPKAEFSDDALAAIDTILQTQIPITIAQVILCALLLVSGIALLRSASWSLKLSNLYSGLSILVKVALLILAITTLAPAYDRLFDGISGMNPAVFKILRPTMTISIYSPVLIGIYPLLTYFLLNTKVVKNYLASR